MTDETKRDADAAARAARTPGMFIPQDRLPEGFADRLGDAAASPQEPKPASTIVLLRDSRTGPEVLLLKRNRTAGFVPGAYVFPGGRVDDADADTVLTSHVEMATEPPAPYWTAALRELFEEAGVLLARDATGAFAPDASATDLAAWRDGLLEDRVTLVDVLRDGAFHLAFDRMVYIAHWITPVAEPRRYDTRFFLAAMPEGRVARADAREMSDALWLAPATALERFAAGSLPMVFPTVRTLESLLAFESAGAALDAMRGRTIDPVLPRLVRTADGVALVLEDGEAES